MAFDPQIFAMEIALGIIPVDKIPEAAQSAMEDGFDGPNVVNMAILDPKHLWAIDQAIPPMLEELRVTAFSRSEAAIGLSRVRAEQILANSEDPRTSESYFYKLWLASDYASELSEIGNLDDTIFVAFATGDCRDPRSVATSCVERFSRTSRQIFANLFSPSAAVREPPATCPAK